MNKVPLVALLLVASSSSASCLLPEKIGGLNLSALTTPCRFVFGDSNKTSEHGPTNQFTIQALSNSAVEGQLNNELSDLKLEKEGLVKSFKSKDNDSIGYRVRVRGNGDVKASVVVSFE
jgi:hypothetical protein